MSRRGHIGGMQSSKTSLQTLSLAVTECHRVYRVVTTSHSLSRIGIEETTEKRDDRTTT